MFIANFTSIAILAGLMGASLQCQESTITQPIQTTFSSISSTSKLGTTVEFTINDSNYDKLFDYYGDNYQCNALYPIKSSEFNTIGYIGFKFIEMENHQFYFHVQPSAFEDVYNLYVNVEVYVTSDDSDNYSGTSNFEFNMKFSEDTTKIYNTPVFGTTQNSFFNLDDGEVYVTITLSPMGAIEFDGTVDLETAYENGKGEGYQEGYADGYADASSQNTTAVTIFTGIVTIGLMPINFFLGILNFEVFGINIGALVASFLTIAITLIIVRIIFSGGNGKGGDK